MLQLYKAFILPHFYYCSIWHFCGKRNTDKMEALNKRILKFILKDNDSNYSQLLEKSRNSHINVPQRIFDARECENDVPLLSFLRPWDARKNQLACGQGRWREDNVTTYPWSIAHSTVFQSRDMLASVPCPLVLVAIVVDILFLLFHW